MSEPNRGTIVLRSLVFFRRSHLGLALGIAAATAVIVGALVVGDSVRDSLRNLVLQRLANVEFVLQWREFFDPQVVERIDLPSIDSQLSLAPAILLSNSSAELKRSNELLRASRVQVIGIDQRFVDSLTITSRSQFPQPPGPDEIYLNSALARELKVTVGDQVTLRLSQLGGVPADNPLGRRDETSLAMPRQKVIGIVSDDSIGGFRMQPSQEEALNVFASMESLQDLLAVDRRVNAALVFSAQSAATPDLRSESWAERLSQQLKPSIEDYGLQLNRRVRTFPDDKRGESQAGPPTTLFDYYQLSSKHLLIEDDVADAVTKSLEASQSSRMLTYLANSIAKVERPTQEDERQFREPFSLDAFTTGPEEHDRSQPTLPPLSRIVPYSIVVGVSPLTDLQLVQHTSFASSRMRAPPCWINSWLADELQAAVGDWIQMQYYEPETNDGELKQSQVQMMIVGIVPVVQPDRPHGRNRSAKFEVEPTRYNDPDLTPTVAGITDQGSISNWDVPFELEQRDLILPQDDKYWEDHRLTPKIFIPYEYSKRMFGSRFGNSTAIHIPSNGVDNEQELRQAIERGLATVGTKMGWSFRPVRFLQLKSATGTTPFDFLFLSLSFFVIVAALLLVALLFKLAVQQRTSQLGLFLAQGYTQGSLRRLILLEMLVVAILGAALGVPLGLGYARAMVAGLETWWIGAISTQFLEFSFRVSSLGIGALVGVVVSILTILVVLMRATALQPLQLLRGDDGQSLRPSKRPGAVGWTVALVCFLAAILLITMAFGQLGVARSGFFFGSGMLLLCAALLALRQWLASDLPVRRPEKQQLLSLAMRSIVRNPVRSSLTMGLLAVASFLIMSMSVFQVSPNRLGYGGFDLLGVSTQPIYDNLGSPKALSQAIGTPAAQLLGTTIIPLRMRDGDDASCTNLFQVTQPTILGLSQKLQKLNELTSRFQFSWAANSEPASPWTVLQSPGTGRPENPIPVVLDQNTAMWSLKQGGSLDAPIVLELDGQTVHLRVVGLLANSVLQGKLIISERNFEQLFPRVSGYRFFLISSGDRANSDSVAKVLETGWSDAGMDVTSSEIALQRLLGVQNTYISAFQALGALGLLLGTLGLIAVQLRSVLERRRELALMQALGFSRMRIGKLLTLETAVLLLGGLLIGVSCAAIALMPYIIDVGPQLSILNSLLMLAFVLICGLTAAGFAVQFAMKLPLLQSLRGE